MKNSKLVFNNLKYHSKYHLMDESVDKIYPQKDQFVTDILDF